MNSDKITEMLNELRTKEHSAPDVAQACTLVASNEHFRAFVLVNLVKMLALGGFGTEQEIVTALRAKLNRDKKFEAYLLSPYLATIAIGFELGKSAK
jgi:hypothetical protein